jgi:hypothetical protein
MLQLTLKSLNFLRPVAPEVAGSSPVLPPGESVTWQKLGAIGYKTQTGAVAKIHEKFTAFVPTFSAAANLTGRIADPRGSHVDGVVGFIQSIGKAKRVGHPGKKDARGGLAGYHFDRSRARHRLSRSEAVWRAIEQMLVSEGKAKR